MPAKASNALEPRSTPNRIDVAKALKLRLQGNTLEEIGSVFGVSRNAVHQALDKFESLLGGMNKGDLTAYAEQRRDILNAAESKLLSAMLNDKAIEKAPLAARTMAFGVLYDKRRLEEGKSTENLGILGKLLIGAEDELGKSADRVAASQQLIQKDKCIQSDPVSE